MKNKIRGFGKIPAVALALVSALAFLPATLSAQSAEEFFKGKTLTYIVATSPGGNYDGYARLITKYMQKYLPVSKIVVKNMPGAGHIIGANHIFAAKPNGLTIGSFNTGLIYAQLLKRKGIQFDLAKMTYLGKAAADPRVVMVGTKSGINSFQDLRASAKRIKFSAAGVGSASFNESKMVISAFNLPIDVIAGYSGKAGEMGILRGELHGELGSLSTYYGFLKNGYGKVVLLLGTEKVPGYENVPMATEVSDDPEVKALMALISAQAGLARLTAGPPGMPADRRALLIKAYRSALEDPDLLADAKKTGSPIVPEYGEAVAAKIREALHQPPKTLALIKSVMDKKADTLTAKGPLLAVEDKGKVLRFKGPDGKTVKAKVSGSRTRIMINNKPGDRKKLKEGMECEVEYKPGGKNEPVLVSC